MSKIFQSQPFLVLKSLVQTPHLLLRGIYLCVLWLLFDALMAKAFNLHGNTLFHGGWYLLSILCSLGLSGSWYGISLIFNRIHRSLTWIWSISWGLILAISIVTNAYIYFFFGEYLFPSALSFVDTDKQYMLDYLHTFNSFFSLTLIIVLWIIFIIILLPPAKVDKRKALSLNLLFFMLSLILGISGLKIMEKKDRYRLLADVTSLESLSKHFARMADHTPPLRPTIRLLPQNIKADFQAPKTIIVIVNESMGIHSLAPFSSTNGAPRFNRRLIDTSQWLLYNNAVTNASATEISMVSIYTGVGPEESYNKSHAMPMIWDMAWARGYHTAYITSQRLRWACLWDFLLKEPIELKSSIDVNGLPVVHDMGSEDLLSAKLANQWIRKFKSDEPLLLFFNTNALHAPFQDHSNSMDLSNVPGDRYEKALTLVDSTMESLFQTLEKTGRYKDAMIIVTGDHGETPSPHHPFPRISSYFQEITQVPLSIKFPASISDSIKASLRQSRSALRENLDINPTIAQALGFKAPIGQFWKGRSLLQSPDLNKRAITLNTNETRRWDHQGFALSQDHLRWVCSDEYGCLFYNLINDPLQDRALSLPDSLAQPWTALVMANSNLAPIFQSPKRH